MPEGNFGIFFMFTGIISCTGKFVENTNSTFAFWVRESFFKKVKAGSSVAVNGVCLTVVKKNKDHFQVNVILETVKRTMFKNLKKGDLVNLEKPMRVKDFLSGHLVQGHVDRVGKVTDIKKYKNSWIVKISHPQKISKYIVEKGSIAVDGVSLTVVETFPTSFTVGIIPYTWRQTKFHQLKPGDLVNLEVDIIAKYVEKLLHSRGNL